MEISYRNMVRTNNFSTFCQHFEEEMSGASRKLTDVDGGQGKPPQNTPRWHIDFFTLVT